MSEKFNPTYPIGKNYKEAIQYLSKFNIKFSMDDCKISHGSLSIHKSYETGTHRYKFYKYNSNSEDDWIVSSFEGVH